MTEKRATALRFVLLLSLVSLFSDTVYEGARSVSGPFLAEIGASAFTISAVAGVGELLGYGLRLLSGKTADRTSAYWPLTILGYFINLVAVPALAFANRWEVAALLLIAERAGKAIRTPARDVMLSAAGEQLGPGLTFGLHRALDQVGAIVGPLIVAFTVFKHQGVRAAFIVLAVPAVLALVCLLVARFIYPRPENLAIETAQIQTYGLRRSFWIYLAAGSLLGAGYVDYPLIAYHFKRTAQLDETWIAVFYSVAMATDAIAGLALGKLFDRWKLYVLAGVAGITTFIAPTIFLAPGLVWPLIGVGIWGIGMGAQGSIMRAVITELVPSTKRGGAYGLFGLVYGLSWFAGSLLLGFLYQYSVIWLVLFSATTQAIAIPLILLAEKSRANNSNVRDPH